MTSISRFLFVLLILSIVGKALASNVILNWDASTSPNAVGYNVYFGTNSGNYLYKLDAGNATSAVISNLNVGLTYYFVVRTYDASGNGSLFSSEVGYHVPYMLNLRSRTSPSSPVSMQFETAPAHWYQIQSSTDLKNWTAVWQTGLILSNSQVQFTDSSAGTPGSRYYRLAVH